MINKERVLERWPDAYAQYHHQGSIGNFWSIWTNHSGGACLGFGQTEDAAWNSAVIRLRFLC